MCGLQLWIIMTNVWWPFQSSQHHVPYSLSRHCSLWHHLVSSRPPTPDASKAACHCVVLRALSSRHCLSSDSQMHLHGVGSPCVWWTGENMSESPTSLSPSSASHLLGFFFICHWQCERKGARFLRVSHQKLQVQIPNGPLSEQEHSQLAFVTMKQASFKFTEGHFYTKKKSSVWLNLQPFRLNHLLVVLWIINIMKPLIIYGRLLLFNVSITLLGSFSFLLPLKNGSIYKLLPIIAHISVSRLVMCTKSNALRILAAWCCYGIQPYYIMLMLRTPQFLLFFLGGGGCWGKPAATADGCSDCGATLTRTEVTFWAGNSLNS